MGFALLFFKFWLDIIKTDLLILFKTQIIFIEEYF